MKNLRHWYLAAAFLVVLWPAGPLGGQESRQWKGGKWASAAKAAEGAAGGQVAPIRQLLKAGRNKQAVKAARKFLKKHPDSAGREEVYLLAGRAEINRGRYYQGYEWFEKQLDEFPNGRLSEEALEWEYEIAEAFLNGKKRIVLRFMKLPAADEGVEILTRIAEHAPGTDIGASSLLRIGDYYYAKGKWTEATEAYDTFLELFAKSPKAAYVMLQAARATYSSFGGVAFDDTPLLEAEQRFRVFAASFPAEASKANVRRILKQIAATRAHKLFWTGDLYDRTGRPTAAAYYYKKVVEEYPDTVWAKSAERALSRLGGVRASKPAGSPSWFARRWPFRKPTWTIWPRKRAANNPKDAAQARPANLQNSSSTSSKGSENK